MNECVNFGSPNIHLRNKYQHHKDSSWKRALCLYTECCGFNDSVHCLNFHLWLADVQVCSMCLCFWAKQRQIAAWHCASVILEQVLTDLKMHFYSTSMGKNTTCAGFLLQTNVN